MFCNVTDIQLAHLLITGELQACSAHRQLFEMLHMCTAAGLNLNNQPAPRRLIWMLIMLSHHSSWTQR